MMERLRAVHLHLLIGIGSLALVAVGAFYLQQRLGLAPCPLCILQRFAYILLGVTALVAAAHRPVGAGRHVYTGLMLLWGAAGIALSAWNVYLTYAPEKATCRISWEEKLVNALPLSEWWPKLFEAMGDCGTVTWRFLGLSIPEMSLIAFAVLIGLVIWAARLRR